jgi:hypothetical protein
MVAPDSLISLIEESKLGRQEILNFVRLRSDYKSAWASKYGL